MGQELIDSEPLFSLQIDGSPLPAPEQNFRPGLFGEVCRLVWPDKPDAAIAALVGCTDRQARDYLAERAPAPFIVYLAILIAIMPRKRR